MTTHEIVTWTRVERDDPAYIARAQAEAEFWQRQSIGLLATVEKLGGDSVIEQYTNERFTGDPAVPWYATIARHGPFRRGLFLGTSGLAQDAHILETNPDLHVTICDISAGSLERWQEVLGAKFPGRVDTIAADLNFAELEPDTYDLVVSSSTLHHVVNLEHIAAQINGALTPEGRFFLQDYVGENFFCFSPAKKRIFEDLYNRDIARQRGRSPGLVWTNEDRSLSSPLCGIRSADILDAMAGELKELDRRVAGAVIGTMLQVRPADGKRPGVIVRMRRRVNLAAQRGLGMFRRASNVSFLSTQYLDELRLVDSVLSDAGTLKPFDAFVVYGKR